MQAMLLRLITENVLTLSECPPQQWEGDSVRKWRERAQKLDKLCTMAIICSLGNLNLSEIPSRSQPNKFDPVKSLIDYCMARVEEIGLEEEGELDEYIVHEISRFQIHPIGMMNYRR